MEGASQGQTQLNNQVIVSCSFLSPTKWPLTRESARRLLTFELGFVSCTCVDEKLPMRAYVYLVVDIIRRTPRIIFYYSYKWRSLVLLAAACALYVWKQLRRRRRGKQQTVEL